MDSLPVRRRHTSAVRTNVRLVACNGEEAARFLTEATGRGGEVARRAFDAMMTMGKIDVAGIEAAASGAKPRGG